jgi:xanthine dehydrogenase YagR molybdenum-binding subunit
METKDIKVVKSSQVGRVDGPLKVTGRAVYTSDHHFPFLTYAVPVCAKIGKGKITKLDVSEAKKMKGVIEVFTRHNIGPLYRPTPEPGMEYRTDEPRPPFEDDEIRYYGQFIAVIVAETFEIAQRASHAVKVTYESKKPNVSKDLHQEDIKKTDVERGDSKKSFQNSAVKVESTYSTPVEVHNPIELHATVAVWEGTEKVTIYETSQAISTHRNVLSQVLGIPKENVQVITKYLGSGFGGKLWPWPHSSLAAATSRIIGRPVKLVVDRHMEFTNVGHRPRTQQKIQLGADEKGVLKALIHDYATQVSPLEEYKENCGEVSGFLYNIPDVKVTSGVARRNQAVPTSMRGPGAVPGLFALESAMDELAIALKMDPVELRILNDTQFDLGLKKKFSSRHLKECLELGSKKFGWEKRTPEIGSMRDGEEILGWGVSSCTWQAQRLDADASFEFKHDGHVSLSCGTHDIGTGMYTVLAQIVQDETGVPFDRIEILLGDTSLPKGPIAGGSMATGSVVPAVLEAIRKATKNLQAAAIKAPASPLHGKKEEEIKYEKGKVNGIDFGKLLHQINMKSIAGKGSSKGNFATKDKEEFSTKSFGAQFVEIGWNPELARLRVRRVVSVIDAGKIINFKPARNQIEGAIVMGIGMGMFEEAIYDERDGNVVNANLADYVMAVHADCPDIDVTFLDYPDKAVNELGARGVGEIGLAGIASAMTAAVYHATGIRVRDLPVTIEKLLESRKSVT